VSSLLKTSVKSLQQQSSKLTTAKTRISEFQDTLNGKIEKEEVIVEGVTDNLEKLQKLNSAFEYFRNIQDIQDIR
jgi:hypothetical protein